MEWISFLSAVFLAFLYQIQGSSPATSVFVQNGKDLLLDVMKADLSEKCFFISWKFNQDKNLVISGCSPGKVSESQVYDPRIEFFQGNFSMKLKEVQKSDSGVYSATTSGTREEKIAEYNVTVQDPVSPAKLTLDSVSTSSASCNFTMNCSTGPSVISSTFRCYNKTCSQEGGHKSMITKDYAFLLVYLSNESIICNHSNQVSWLQDMRKIEHFCQRPVGHSGDSRSHVVILIVIFVILILAVVAYVCCRRHRKKYNTESTEHTIYAVPQIETAEVQNTSPVAEASSPSTTYSLVGKFIRKESAVSVNETLPQSLYASVAKPQSPENHLQ